MQRVLILGCPGSGKSTFARKLREKTGLPIVYLDLLWHNADRTTVSREVFDERLEQALAGEAWIMDGNYSRTVEKRLERADTVFFFDLPTEDCLAGVSERIGKKREDMPWVEECFDPEFRAFIEEFAKNRRPQLLTLLEGFGGEKITFFSRAEADRYWKEYNEKQGG